MSLPSPVESTQCTIALKEWATVLQAMDRDQQLVLIRKGGLIEPGSGFEMASNQFVFYPTFEHQAVNYLRPEYRGYFNEASAIRAPKESVRFDWFGKTVSTHTIHDPNLIQRISRFHIYNEAFITQRLKWQPETPLLMAVVRVYRLKAALTLPVIADYTGCKSWVTLNQPISLEGAVPILNDEAFQKKLLQLNALLP